MEEWSGDHPFGPEHRIFDSLFVFSLNRDFEGFPKCVSTDKFLQIDDADAANFIFGFKPLSNVFDGGGVGHVTNIFSHGLIDPLEGQQTRTDFLSNDSA